jgi:hypothetical protein
METYLHTFIENLPDSIKNQKTPQKLDIVLDGGAFNGSYLFGAMIFLREMEKRNYIRIQRISGCSIGSLVALLYFSDSLDIFSSLYDEIRSQLVNHYNLEKMLDLKKYISKHIPPDICSKIFRKLYITYHNVKTGKKIVKRVYKNTDEVLDTITKSCFLPFLTNGSLLYKERYIDGINAHFFSPIQGRKRLFLNLISLEKCSCLFNIKNEKTNFHRVLSGLLDIHHFFIKGSSTQMCSYLEHWTFSHFITFYVRSVLEKMFFCLVYFLNLFQKFFPGKNSVIYGIASKIFFELWKKIIEYYCL